MKYKVHVTLVVFFLSQILISQIYFEDRALDLGINISGTSGSILGGVSFFDFDNDGWDDLTFASKYSFPVRFFKNTLGTFTEQNFNITISGHSKQVLWVDYDNDGDNDLFVTKVDGVNKLYQNNGSFVFTDITASAGFPNTSILYTYGATFGDYDNDGFLDVFISNKDDSKIIPNQLYHNNGDGTFTDVSLEAGISTIGHLSFCATFFDYNKDGYQDIYISNDRVTNTNILYENNTNGTFTDVSILSGTNIAANAMSTTIGDYNNDGWLDIYVTNTSEGNYLLKNNGDETFTNVALITGTTFNSIGWGANFFDADNDTDLDLYVSSMISNPDIGLFTYAFYECQPDFSYIIPIDAGFINDQYASFANAIGDFNNDGYTDFVVANQAPDNHSLWENLSESNNNWLKISLEGVTSNKMGIGSWIEVYANNKSMYRYKHCGESFLGQNSGVEIFGIGDANLIDYVKVTWLSGAVDILNNVTPNQNLTIVENSTLSLKEFDQNNFVIYPNPSKGIVNIKSTSNQDFSLDIIDSIGRKMSSNYYRNSLNNINIEKLPIGVYFFRFTIEDGEFTKKVVIY